MEGLFTKAERERLEAENRRLRADLSEIGKIVNKHEFSASYRLISIGALVDSSISEPTQHETQS